MSGKTDMTGTKPHSKHCFPEAEVRGVYHAIHDHVEQERLNTADALQQRRDEFMKLKIEGILECSELLVVSLTSQREQYILGRRTIPEMDIASVACAIQNMWLAARAQGIGLGWVSFFEPEVLASLISPT